MVVRKAAIILLASATLAGIGNIAAAGEHPAMLETWRKQSRPVNGHAAREIIEHQFSLYDPNYLLHKREFAPRVMAAAHSLSAMASEKRSAPCSTQMYLEAKWL